jgi:hypothetical protein
MEPRDTFISERLVLRRPALADTLAVYEYASDSEVTWFMDLGDPPEPRVGKMNRVHLGCDSEAQRPCSWHGLASHPKARGKMGYVLNRRYWDQGYATEAAATVRHCDSVVPGAGRILSVRHDCFKPHNEEDCIRNAQGGGTFRALGQRQSSPVGASAFRIQFIELSRSYGD